MGKIVLNRNPENYFADVEQAAFSPGNFVPGIATSPDEMLQGRLFSYHDTHRHRLGPNYHLLPVNRARACPAQNYQQDGFMRFDGNFGGSPNYFPNSFGGPAPQPKGGEPLFEVSGTASRKAYTHPNDDFFQPGELYRRVMTDEDRDHLIGNIVDHLRGAKTRIHMRQTAIFYKADSDYGRRLAEGLELKIKDVERLAGMSKEERAKATDQGAYGDS